MVVIIIIAMETLIMFSDEEADFIDYIERIRILLVPKIYFKVLMEMVNVLSAIKIIDVMVIKNVYVDSKVIYSSRT